MNETLTTTELCGKCSKPKGNTEECCKCGRPTKYNEEILQKTRDYIENCKDIPEDKEHNIPKQVNLPTIEGLAYEIKVNKTTIQEWRQTHEEFSILIDELLAKQARSLINNGLSGNYSQVIAKVLLTKHGYREGVDATTNDKDIPTPVLVKFIDESNRNT